MPFLFGALLRLPLLLGLPLALGGELSLSLALFNRALLLLLPSFFVPPALLLPPLFCLAFIVGAPLRLTSRITRARGSHLRARRIDDQNCARHDKGDNETVELSHSASERTCTNERPRIAGNHSRAVDVWIRSSTNRNVRGSLPID